MKYTYDIVVNYNYPLKDFYEWNQSDKYTTIKKARIYKITKKDLEILKYNKIKSEKIINKSCIFIDNDDTLAVRFNQNGISIGKSRIPFNIENEILYSTKNNKIESIKYEVIKKDEINHFESINEIKRKKFVISKLKNINNKYKLKYIYYECFNKKEQNPKNILLKIIKDNWDEYGLKIYNLL